MSFLILTLSVMSSTLFVTTSSQGTPSCGAAGGFCWPVTSSCPNGFRRDNSVIYSCAEVTHQCCVLVAGCEMSGGFCWSPHSACPQGFVTDPDNSNYYGCSRVDRQCCTKAQENVTTTTTDPKDRSVCGLGSSNTLFRVLNGAQTGTCDWPFVVSIRGRKSPDVPLSYLTSSHACAGVLVDAQWVLTSPICVLSAGLSLAEAPRYLLVVAGEHNVTGIDLDPVTGDQLEQVIEVEDVHFEPRYPFTFQVQTVAHLNDAKTINSHGIALLRLKQPITGQCVGVACLPTDDEATNQCARQPECVILGWGYNKANFQGIDDTLRKGTTRLTSRSGCDFLSQRLNVSEFRPEGSICQSPRDQGVNTDSCLGDEGGPVLCAQDGKNWVVRAVLPFNLCRDGNYQLWVTEVSPYLAWIKQTMAAYP